MKLVVGLGNPGEKYKNTRHNLGFIIVEHFLKDFQNAKNTFWENSSKFKSDISQIEWQPRHGILEKVILAKPQTYMNNSGMAVKIIADFYKIPADNVWVIHDDIDLPLGSMKIRFGGASAGHHGVESIMKHLNTDRFFRFRMGTGIQKSPLRQGFEGQAKFKVKSLKLRNVEDFVLSDFSGSEKGKVKNLIKRGVNAIESSLEDSLERAINRFNTK
jgi:PTH1 family peptidyl-tRNA hydrolase